MVLKRFFNVNNHINKCDKLNKHVRVETLFYDKKNPGRILEPEFVRDKMNESDDILRGNIRLNSPVKPFGEK